jgi:hypothetical protein
VVHDRPWEVEEGVIRSLSLPLNLKGNTDHPFYPKLHDLRTRAMADARKQPVLKGVRG